MDKIYQVHHRGSRHRGRRVRLITRPVHWQAMPAGLLDGELRRGPRSVLAELADGPDAGVRFCCPWRGLWRTQ